jgi:AcrR family transcriptional regulator
MKASKRMIYHCFGSREGLYLPVLEEVRGDIRRMEQRLDLENLTPADAVRRLGSLCAGAAQAAQAHDRRCDPWFAARRNVSLQPPGRRRIRDG